jgi:hypothetical protein
MRLGLLRKRKAFSQEVRCFFLLGRISGYRKNASRRAFSQGS